MCQTYGCYVVNDLDVFVWKLTNNGTFSVKSMYKDLMNGHARYLSSYLWKLKIPLKIKIFMWFLHKNVLLTKDNLAKRKWQGCTKCFFLRMRGDGRPFIHSVPFC